MRTLEYMDYAIRSNNEDRISKVVVHRNLYDHMDSMTWEISDITWDVLHSEVNFALSLTK